MRFVCLQIQVVESTSSSTVAIAVVVPIVVLLVVAVIIILFYCGSISSTRYRKYSVYYGSDDTVISR